MINRRVAEIFTAIAEILELKGENPFRIRAYQRAARTVEGYPKDVAALSPEELLKLPGVGKDLTSKIQEIAQTGGLKDYESLRKEVPAGILTLLSVPGLGPKTAKLFYEKLKVTNMDQLERLARKGRLSGLPGIKKKTEDNILKSIAAFRRHRERRPLGLMLPVAEEIVAHLKAHAPVRRLSTAGSIRRQRDTVKDIDILCTSSHPEKTMEVFTSMDNVSDILMHGTTRSSVTITDGVQVDLRVVEEASFGSALSYFTGSKAHNIRLREIAVKRGLKLNEYGLFNGTRRIAGRREEGIYEALGLPYIPPELREDTGEVEAAQAGRLPKLVELKDIKGDLHVHTSRSDGKHTLEELARSAQERGYAYVAVTDHSKGLGIAGGLTEEDLLDEIREIDALNKKLRGFRFLKGVEVDIRGGGELDLEDKVLRKLDLVVASIHSGFTQTSAKLTARLVAAMRNPLVKVIAHPTGRLLGQRDPYDVDMERVLQTAKETGTALELNAYPMRLDLNDTQARAAREMGIPVAISTDAHLVSQFDFMAYGVSTARRGWLEKKDVLNTASLPALLKKLKK
jgi:DNA polymerase (family 10)